MLRSVHTQAVGAPWGPLPSCLIKCIFSRLNHFLLTSASAWPAASTSLPLLPALWQSLQAKFLQAQLCSQSALGPASCWRYKCVVTNFHASVLPSEAPQRPGQRRAVAKMLLCQELLSQGTLGLPMRQWFIYLEGAGAPSMNVLCPLCCLEAGSSAPNHFWGSDCCLSPHRCQLAQARSTALQQS